MSASGIKARAYLRLGTARPAGAFLTGHAQADRRQDHHGAVTVGTLAGFGTSAPQMPGWMGRASSNTASC
jgi:hypothetical protein